MRMVVSYGDRDVVCVVDDVVLGMLGMLVGLRRGGAKALQPLVLALAMLNSWRKHLKSIAGCGAGEMSRWV